MNKNIRKIIRKIVFTVTSLIVLTAALSLSAHAASKPKSSFPTSQTVYLEPTMYGSDKYISIQLGDLAKCKTITNVKSSNTAIVEPYRLYRYTSTTVSTDLKTNKINNTYNTKSGYIEMYAKKTGTVTISFKADNKTYSCKVKILSYQNPLKSLKFKGVDDKERRSIFKQYARIYDGAIKLSKNSKEGFMQVVAADGWKISSINFRKSENDHTYEFHCGNVSKMPTKMQLYVPAMKKGSYHSFSILLINTKNSAQIELYATLS